MVACKTYRGSYTSPSETFLASRDEFVFRATKHRDIEVLEEMEATRMHNRYS